MKKESICYDLDENLIVSKPLSGNCTKITCPDVDNKEYMKGDVCVCVCVCYPPNV